MEKKTYIAPETVKVTSFTTMHFFAVSKEEYGYGGDAEAKKIDFDDFNSEEDIWSGRQTKDAWERWPSAPMGAMKRNPFHYTYYVWFVRARAMWMAAPAFDFGNLSQPLQRRGDAIYEDLCQK